MKTVQKLALLLVALFVAHGAIAQTKTKSVIETDSTTVTTIVKTFPKFSPKHDIRVGIGTMSVPTIVLLDTGSFGGDILGYDFRRDMANCDTFRTPRYFVGNYSLSYTYQERRWLQYGGMATFGASTCWRRDVATGEKIENLSQYCLSIMPTVRFNWFYREAVQLYSSVSVGVVTDFDSAYLWGDATLLGCSFGRKFFGFAEFGLGISGWARAGFGYRFNANKK